MAANNQEWVDSINRWRVGFDGGYVLGLEISKPKPWPPAALILELHGQGLDVECISKRVGYSKISVERAIRTRGEDIRTGDQCGRYAGRLFSLDDALREMPLPCGPTCVCAWRPRFRFGSRSVL